MGARSPGVPGHAAPPRHHHRRGLSDGAPAIGRCLLRGGRARNLRMICGKILMDRNSPDYLRDDVPAPRPDCRDLIQRWHGKARLGYALTPRFAPTSSPEQLARSGALDAETPGLWMQTHLGENRDEIAWVKELFPEARSYLDVYDRSGLLDHARCSRHCIHLDGRIARASWRATARCRSARLLTCSSAPGSSIWRRRAPRRARRPRHRCRRRHLLFDAADSGRGLQGADDSWPCFNAWRGLWRATLGGADRLSLDGKIGNFAVGKEADCVVLDSPRRRCWTGATGREDPARTGVRADDAGRSPGDQTDYIMGASVS